jgi:hypothetical protein
MENTNVIENEIAQEELEKSNTEQLNAYYFARFVSAIKNEKRNSSILINELDSVTEGKEIIICNAK